MRNGTLTAVLVLVAVFILMTVVNIVYKYFNKEYETETALLSVGSDADQVEGVFIRDEKVVTYPGEGVVSYEISDGGKLGIGSTIATVYASEAQIDIKQRIASLEHELELIGRISNPGTTQTAQPSNIAELFTQTYKDYLYEREQGDLSGLQSMREEMAVLLSTYQLVTGSGGNYEVKKETIQSEIDTLSQAQEPPLDTITADETAYFVSYADGYEDTLTLENLESLTPETLEGIHDNPSNENGVIGKLIKGYEWALAAVVDNSEHVYEEGDRVTLKFLSTAETVTGTVTMLKPGTDDTKTLIAVQCEAMTHDLVQHRAERVEIIRGEYQGIMVPRDALRFRMMTDEDSGETEDVRGVYVLSGEQPEFRRLDVIYEGADYVISRQTAEDGYLQLYDAIITKGIDADGQ